MPSVLVYAVNVVPVRSMRTQAGIGFPLPTFARVVVSASAVARTCQFTTPAAFVLMTEYQSRFATQTRIPAFWPLTVGFASNFIVAEKSPTMSFESMLPENTPPLKSTPVLDTTWRDPGVVVPTSYAPGGFVHAHFGSRTGPPNSSDARDRSEGFQEIVCQKAAVPGPPTFETYVPEAPRIR